MILYMNMPQITIIRSKRRKRTVSLHVEQDGGLRVLAPNRTSLKFINSFIEERKDWIENRRKEIQTKKERSPIKLEHNSKISFIGNKIRLIVKYTDKDIVVSSSYCEKNSEIYINIPSNMPDDVQKEEIKTEIILWYKKQAREYLPKRMKYWAEKTSLYPTKIITNNAKQQWGSCNSKNEIRLNWRLILANSDLIDYVIVHELCHIKHKNHGVRFWALCAKIIPDMIKRRKNLRKWEESHHPAYFP